MNKNKLLLPKKIKVGGININITCPCLDIDEDYSGIYNNESFDIAIRDGIPNSAIVCNFIHEVLHAVDHIYLDNAFLNATNEQTICTLECALFQMLLDNYKYLSVKTNKLPEQLVLLGHKFKVQISKFGNSPKPLSFRTDMTNHIIYLHEGYTGLKDIQRKFQDLFSALLVCLLDLVNIDIEKISITQIVIFGRGLYQVFNDCNMYGIIESVKE